MKRLLLPVLLLAATTTAHAQASAAPIGVTAKVQSAVTMSGMVPLDFGTGIVPGTPTTVAPASGGRLMVSYNVSTQLSMPNSVSLTRTGGGSVLVTLDCAQASTGTAVSPTPFATDCAGGYTTTLVGAARTDWYLYLGGTIAGAATSAVPAGTYTGNVTVTATYTTF
ncbi:MAG: hypothetical protein JWL60_1523 [Gemmatimonadetes bacterium]|nr:hypothetical protein [Gemmatimonadota bacterium]